MTIGFKPNLLFNSSYINGDWFKASSSKTFDVYNPSTQEVIIAVDDGGLDAVEASIQAAHMALPHWSSRLVKDRSLILENFYDLILENQKTLAEIMTLESGKPLKESKVEVVYAASFIKWFAEEAKHSFGSVIPTPHKSKRILTIKQPIGVVGAITPWNFPLAMITRKIAPALAAGCTAVVRPSEATPLSALALAELSRQAGIPAGVLNVCVGSEASAMGEALCRSEIVRKITFTGSTRVGAILMKQCAPSIKKLSLELGGNAPLIVFQDANLEAAVQGAVAAKFRNAGQTCVAANRILVHEKIYDQFAEMFVKAVAALKCGDGFQADSDIGPLINEKACIRMQEYIKDAVNKGGKILLGGKQLEGQFFQPTVLSNANSKMTFYQEEIFGPIAPLYKFANDQEALLMANDTIYGLAAYIYSESISKCWQISEALEYGMIGVNEGLISTEVAPFGGIKSSGMGREGSDVGLDEYLELKYLCFGNINS